MWERHVCTDGVQGSPFPLETHRLHFSAIPVDDKRARSETEKEKRKILAIEKNILLYIITQKITVPKYRGFAEMP